MNSEIREYRNSYIREYRNSFKNLFITQKSRNTFIQSGIHSLNYSFIYSEINTFSSWKVFTQRFRNSRIIYHYLYQTVNCQRTELTRVLISG